MSDESTSGDLVADRQGAHPRTPPTTLKDITALRFAPTKERLYRDVEFLASDRLGGRAAGSAGERLAAEYVSAAFARSRLAHSAGAPSYWQPFVMSDGRHSGNVLGWLAGRKPIASGYVVITAHIDHLGRDGDKLYRGADDNASGVAGLLGIAAAWHASGLRPRYSILFAATSAEEVGLQGAKALVANPPGDLALIRAVINIDMISRAKFYDYKMMAPLKNMIGIPDGPGVGLLSGGSGRLFQAARDTCNMVSLNNYAPRDYPAFEAQIRAIASGRGDFAPFAERGVPYVFFSTSEHDDYHKTTDTLDKVDRDTLWQIARAIWYLTVYLDGLPHIERSTAGKSL